MCFKNRSNDFLLLCMLLTTLLGLSWTQAAERHEYYNGIRGLGMGGASVAVVNDETAVILNPAALGKLRDQFITLVDPEIGIGQNNERIFSTNLLGPINPQNSMDRLNETRETRMHLRGQVFPSLVLPNFGMGVLAKYRSDGEVNAAGTEMDWEYENDLAFIFGFNFRLFDGRLKIGFNTRITNRIEYSNTAIPVVSSGTTLNSLGAKEGVGVGSDVGIILTAPWVALPTLAIVARDVGHTHYNFKDGLLTGATEYPTTVGQSVDVGIAFFPIIGKRKRATFTIEARDVLTFSDEADPYRRYHAGIEFNFFDALFLRGGMNQRYWTAGLEMALKNYQIQLATYGEEIGTATTHREDRRYVAKFAFRF